MHEIHHRINDSVNDFTDFENFFLCEAVDFVLFPKVVVLVVVIVGID